jgi:DNA topoisomerase-2
MSEITQLRIDEHVREKDMWVGSKVSTEHNDYYADLTSNPINIIFKTLTFADAMHKCFDEILVNAIDHWRNKNKVTAIYVNILKNGSISVINNGNGFKIKKIKNSEGAKVYAPELAAANPYAGSNHSQTGKVTGGVNGLGMYLTNALSTNFSISTNDVKSGKYYHQTFHYDTKAKKLIIDEPTIKSNDTLPDSSRIKKGGTKIVYLPDFKFLNTTFEKCKNALASLLLTRCIHTSVHTGIDVYFNNQIVPIKSFDDFSGVFMDDRVIFKLKHPKHPWQVSVGINRTGKFESLSIINGVYVTSGTHINYIKDKIYSELKERIHKKLSKLQDVKKSTVTSILFIIIDGLIPDPEFDSQVKTNISGSSKKYKDYVIPDNVLNKILKMVLPILLDNLSSKSSTAPKKSVRSIKKYQKAKYAGTKKSSECILFYVEGDSACSLVHTVLTSNKLPELNYQYCGTYNGQGVGINIRSKSKVKTVGNKTKILCMKKVSENERFNSFMNVMNLDKNKTYETAEEMSTLAYGKLLIVVDQDIDGVGQILGLLISNIHLFWPHLIKNHFIAHYPTPIIRAYSNKNVKVFYTDHEYRTWSESHKTGKYEIKYYKGLATHNDGEAIHMFKNFSDKLIYLTEVVDNNNSDQKLNVEESKILSASRASTAETKVFNIYYGDDAKLRKTELKDRSLEEDKLTVNSVCSCQLTSLNVFKDVKCTKKCTKPSKVSKGGNIRRDITLKTCVNHLRTHTKEFQLDNILRKIPHVIDGLNPARRKILYGSIAKFKNNNKEIKVFQLGGYIAEFTNYHHGSASLESTIVNMAQDFVGSNNIPLLLPLSQFGSRSHGGKDAGASRYIKTKLNKDIALKIFNPKDDHLLKYIYDEGERNEPIHYIPTIPIALLESFSIPATGWKHIRYGCEWDSVRDHLVKRINDDILTEGKSKASAESTYNFPFGFNRWKGRVDKFSSRDWFYGTYEVQASKHTVIITELPYQTWNNPYITKLKESYPHVNVFDKSSKEDIYIEVHFTNKVEFSKLLVDYRGRSAEDEDPFINYLMLKTNKREYLNFISDTALEEFKYTIEIFNKWYDARKAAYVKRLERERLLLTLRLRMFKEIVRFVKLSDKFDFHKWNAVESHAKLTELKFVKFNSTVLKSPGFRSCAEIKKEVLHSLNVSYDYLYTLNSKDKMKKSRDARETHINGLIKELEYLSLPNIEYIIWRKEIKTIDNLIQKANSHPHRWLSSEKII